MTCSTATCACGGASQKPLDLAAPERSTATRAVYRIMNMDCPMEEALIRNKLEAMPGIIRLEFNLMQRLLTVNHELPSTGAIVAALKSIGMAPEAQDAPGLAGATGAPGASRALPVSAIPWGRLSLAALFAALSEAMELINEWQIAPLGLDPQSWQINGLAVAGWLPLAFAVIAILFSGLTTYKKGWIAVRNFNLNINALMSVAVTGAVIIGQYPEAAMVMTLFSLSEAIEARALDRARGAIRDLMDLAPEKATVLQPDGLWQEMEVGLVTRGSRVRVRPGEKVALDGVIVQGHSTVNQAPITGESLPVEKGVGDSVYAGAINEAGSFEFEATAVAADSTLARIIHAVEEAQGSRAPIQRFVDRFARYYTPAIFLTALFIGLVPPLFMDGAWRDSVYMALVVLVIGCPCALVLSTPVSIVSGMAAAARQGILIKGGLFLEQGRLLRWLALDKTGTITHGRPRQTDALPLGGLEARAVTVLAASLAARSDHPVSAAIAESAAEKSLETLAVDDFTALPGRGVSGVVEGRKIYLGNRRLAEELGLCPPELAEKMTALEKEGKSVVALMDGKGAQGLFAVADTVRASSLEAVRELKRMGVRTLMLTGDNKHSAGAIAAEVGVDAFRSDLLPEDKLRVIEGLAEQGGKVGMAGDGINDAPALARADIGFAMAGNGTDTAIETADVALMDDDLRKIPRFIALSKATYAILVQNISLALGVKAVFFALALTGNATMWMAVFADVGAALMVVGNGLRALKK